MTFRRLAMSEGRNLTPLMKKFEEQTEKKARWGGEITSAYRKWRRNHKDKIEPMDIEESEEICESIVDGIAGVYVGERVLLKKVLAASLANGHVLFEDYPGLGKTLLAKTFGEVTGFEYNRIQFTPDLLPADIVGTKVWREEGSFELVKGPIFGNIILADEVNRTPPKTQSALLEAMEENQVTIENETHFLEPPFFVMATQNPIEQEGTYPLPEAQMDRFLLKLSTGYPESKDKEMEVHRRRVQWKKDDPTDNIDPVITPEDFLRLQATVENSIYVDECIMEYITEIVRKTRPRPEVQVGVSTRGGLALLKLSRASALINGRDFVTPDDVKFLAKDALSHRIIIEVEHSLEGFEPEDVVKEAIEKVSVPTDFRPR